MKRFFTLLTVAALLVAPALMAAQAGNAEQEVLALVNKLNDALVKADIATLDKIFADDLTVISGYGDIANKAEYLDMMRSGKYKIGSFENVVNKVRIYGKVAVVNTILMTKGQPFGHPISQQVRQTNVFVKRGGGWQLVQRHSTLIPPPKAELAANAPPSYIADPAVYKLIGENDQFRVIKANWQPGQRDTWHSHMPLAVYPLTDCQSRLYTPDGKSMEITQKAGSVAFLPVVPSHSAENIGTSACEILIVERK